MTKKENQSYKNKVLQTYLETYAEHSQKSKIEFCAIDVNYFNSILNVWQGSEFNCPLASIFFEQRQKANPFFFTRKESLFFIEKANNVKWEIQKEDNQVYILF